MEVGPSVAENRDVSCCVRDKFACCSSEIEVADQTFYHTQSQYVDTGPTSPRPDPITPGAWQGCHWSVICKSLVWLDPEKSTRNQESNSRSSTLEADTLTTGPRRRSQENEWRLNWRTHPEHAACVLRHALARCHGKWRQPRAPCCRWPGGWSGSAGSGRCPRVDPACRSR